MHRTTRAAIAVLRAVAAVSAFVAVTTMHAVLAAVFATVAVHLRHAPMTRAMAVAALRGRRTVFTAARCGLPMAMAGIGQQGCGRECRGCEGGAYQQCLEHHHLLESE